MRKLTRADKHAIWVLNTLLKKQPAEIRSCLGAWQNQCMSLIKEYMGEESDEYKWFSNTQFADATNSIDGITLRDFTPAKINELKYHLIAAVETIQFKGVHKRPERKILSTISEGWLIFTCGLIISSMVGIYYIGYWFGEHSKDIFTVLTAKKQIHKVSGSFYDDTAFIL